MGNAANHRRGFVKKERFILNKSVDSQLSVRHVDVIVKRFGLLFLTRHLLGRVLYSDLLHIMV